MNNIQFKNTSKNIREIPSLNFCWALVVLSELFRGVSA
jgi:hypothetical protein